MARKDNSKIRSYTIGLFLLASLVLLVLGLFSDTATMKLAALGIILLTISSFLLTWVNPVFFTKQSFMFNFAIATSYSFFTSMILIGIIFIVDAFVYPASNSTFTVFGSIFVGMILGRLYIAKELGYYLK